MTARILTTVRRHAAPVARELLALVRAIPPWAWWSSAAAAGVVGLLLILGRDGTRGLALLLLIAPIYGLPTIIAGLHRHPQTVPIVLVNLLLGCTVVGWVAALVWSLIEPRPAVPVHNPPSAPGLAARLARLDQLAADGVISEAERAEQRRRLIQASLDAEQPHPH